MSNNDIIYTIQIVAQLTPSLYYYRKKHSIDENGNPTKKQRKKNDEWKEESSDDEEKIEESRKKRVKLVEKLEAAAAVKGDAGEPSSAVSASRYYCGYETLNFNSK